MRDFWKTYSDECWAIHHLVRLWRVPKACSIPHHFGWRVGDDGEWYGSSCCHGRRCQPTRGFLLRGIRGRLRGRRERLRRVRIWIKTRREIEIAYQHQHVEHSYPFGEDGGHDQLGMRDQPWMIGWGGVSNGTLKNESKKVIINFEVDG